MAQRSPLSVLSGALKIADKVTAMQAVGDKIRFRSLIVSPSSTAGDAINGNW